MNTGSPVYFDNEWFVPVSAIEIAVAMNPRHECCKSHGLVTRVKRNGTQLWTAHMTEEPQETYKNALGVQMFGPSGAPVWTTPAIDEKRGLLYVGTGENTSSPATDKSDSIVAIDLKTGAIKYHFQGYVDDAYNMACGSRRPENCPKEKGPDFDFGASPIIVATPKGKDIVLAGQKSGDVWALDPDDSLRLAVAKQVVERECTRWYPLGNDRRRRPTLRTHSRSSVCSRLKTRSLRDRYLNG